MLEASAATCAGGSSAWASGSSILPDPEVRMLIGYAWERPIIVQAACAIGSQPPRSWNGYPAVCRPRGNAVASYRCGDSRSECPPEVTALAGTERLLVVTKRQVKSDP